MSQNQLVTVAFNGQSILATIVDGKPYVAMKPICDNIGLDWKSQHARINRNPVMRKGVVMMTMPSEGGGQEATCLPLSMLNGWLFGVDVNRVKEEIRPKLIRYQEECFDVLAQHFMPAARPHNPALDYDRISPAQAQDLKELVHSIVDSKVQGFGETWARLHRKFRVNSYLELPAARFDEARDYLLCKLPPEAAAAQSDPIDPLNGPALVAARQVAEDYFEAYRQAVQSGQPTPRMGDLPQEVLQGMVARALFGQRMLSWFDWSTGAMGCKLIPADSSVFSLSSGNYFDLLQQVPMERLPELADAVNQRVACHLGAFTEHLKRNRKPAALA